METKQQKRYVRHKRVRARVKGTAMIPRLCVFRSNKHVYGQLIDDEKGKTILSSSDLELKKLKVKNKKKKPAASPKGKQAGPPKSEGFGGKIAIAYQIGQLIAKKAIDLPAGKAGKKIEKVVFDRGGYKYHGRIKALAEGAREGGLKF